MTIYVQYDPSTADENNHVYFSTCQNNAPNPPDPSPKLQIAYPDDTQVNDMMLDLSQNPPALVPIPMT